jgi:OFA family oxalate/formate antiporter-like MFS transporter
VGSKNKYKNGILPMVLINFSIGSVYCWTLFKEHVQDYTGFSDLTMAWGFSIAIFFLGMSAAFGGKIVEKNPTRSAWLTFIFFTSGWLITGLGIQIRNPWVMLLGFGFVQGIGLGLGYITPVKTMMIWLDNKKGFAAGLSIAAFGLAGVIANPIIEALLQRFQPYEVFYILAVVYGVALIAAARLLYRPAYTEDNPVIAGGVLRPAAVIFSRKFLLLWLVFFLNIASGLALISQEKQIYQYEGIREMGFIGSHHYLILVMITATANLAGRLIMASLQDKMRLKHTPYYVMSLGSLAVAIIAAVAEPSVVGAFVLVFVVQFMFGCGFACMPNILHQNWGMTFLSTVHGFILSAWAIAGLVGNQVSTFVMGHYNLRTLFTVLAVFYAVQFVALLIWIQVSAKDRHVDEVPADEVPVDEAPVNKVAATAA